MLKLREISVLLGGKAGDGIRAGTTLLGRIISRYGYRVFVYDDYPSIIRGGHNFSILRASDRKISANESSFEVLLALDRNTVEKHLSRLKDNGLLIYDESNRKLRELCEGLEGISKSALDIERILKETEAKKVMKNSAIISACSKSLGIEFSVVREVIKKFIKHPEKNIEVAEKSYSYVEQLFEIEKLDKKPLPLLTGNEAIALGAISAGLEYYFAYPMTPSTSILHYLAGIEGVITIHPENEIAVMLMALGASYAGSKTMIGSSGGGFALMVEGLSLAGQAEIPIVVVVSQRAGPSTGSPTYTMQSDLHFILNAGHGEFPRFVTAPGDAEQAYRFTALAMKIAWKYQIPSIILSDKHLSESLFSFEYEAISDSSGSEVLWDGKGEYQRYKVMDDGISPLAFPGMNAVVKVNSYDHLENGITTESPDKIKLMHDKRKKKMKKLRKEVEELDAYYVYDFSENQESVIVSWGSTKNASVEVAEKLRMKLIQPVILEPFPNLEKELKDAKEVICVETNATGQLARLLKANGIKVSSTVLKYDARPFYVDELLEKIGRLKHES